MQKINDFGNWLLDYIQPKSRVVDEALESLQNLIKKTVQQERHFIPIEGVKICVEKVCDTVLNRWKRWVWSGFISGERWAVYYKPSDQQTTNQS